MMANIIEKNSPNSRTLDESTLHAAADWWTRLRDPNGAAETVEQWLEWTEASDHHLEAFERVNEIGNRFGALDEVTRRQLITEFARPVAAAPRRWLPLAAAASTVLVLLGGYLTWSLFGTHTIQQVYVNEVAKNRDITLSDGSTVALGGASTLTTRFNKNERQVELGAGEAFFEVAHSPQRPFVVTAGDLDIHDIGTAFDVRRTGQHVTIAVTEGRVQIYRRHHAAGAKNAPGDMVEAVAGQRVSYDPLKSVMSISSVTAEQATGWRNDRLEFINEPLDVVVANINRYSARPLHIADAGLEPLTFTGTVNTDAIDSWLNALPQVFPLKVSKQPRQVVLSKTESR